MRPTADAIADFAAPYGGPRFIVAPITLAITMGRDPQPHRELAIAAFADLNRWSQVSRDQFIASHRSQKLHDVLQHRVFRSDSALYFIDRRKGIASAAIVETCSNPSLFLAVAVAKSVGSSACPPTPARASQIPASTLSVSASQRSVRPLLASGTTLDLINGVTPLEWSTRPFGGAGSPVDFERLAV